MFISKNKMTNENTEPVVPIDIVYDYIRGQNFSYPSFKTLYDSVGSMKKGGRYQRLKMGLISSLTGIEELNLSEEEEDNDVNYIIRQIQDTGVDNLVKKNSKMILSGNDSSVGVYNVRTDEKEKFDKHLFYKIKIVPDVFGLEIEEHYPTELKEPFEDEQRVFRFFENKELDYIIDDYDFNPDSLRIFTVRQIELGGDRIFKKLFESIANKTYHILRS